MDLVVAAGLLVLAFIIWGIPVALVATDLSISNKEKAIWIFAIGLASWFASLLYQYVAPVLPKQKAYYFDDQRTRDQIPPTL